MKTREEESVEIDKKIAKYKIQGEILFYLLFGYGLASFCIDLSQLVEKLVELYLK